MTQLFTQMRNYAYGNAVIILLLSATVLGIAAYLGSIFLPNLQRDFTIFAIVVPSLTILALIAGAQWSRPWQEGIVFFILGVLWLSMGAWDADIMGSTQCDSLGNLRTPTKDGTISTKSWCYEMRVIEAFSWMLFALFVIFLWIIITLTTRAQAMGRVYAWSEPIFELPWFGQYPGMPDGYYGGGRNYAYPAGVPYMQGAYPGMANGGYVVAQQPGHAVVIQPGANGQSMVTQVPSMVSP
ncbi:hypothetical protein NM688_g5976 [Phlebia brevispora]|uniref:Uncharacterized protein n=1 Tax=Phlebia brevispora TaxID=194682 RepID=A0ACC1SLY4_9APHY|nr:hypothetical protein NM688_g5976 [Phlebia brevispora]